VLTSIVNVLSLFLSLSLLNFEGHKRRIDQGFPHIVGFVPGLGLSSAIYIYVLSAVYFNVDVIANLEKILS